MPLFKLHLQVVFIILLIEPFFFLSESTAQITTNTALPVTEGHFVLRTQFKIIRAADDPTSADRELLVHAFPLVGVYGITSRLAVFSVIPVLDKSIAITMPPQRIKRSTTGIGDIRFFLRHDAYQINRPGKTFRIAPFGGVEAPTGNDNERDSFGRIPQPLQSGSGSWDTFVGVVLTRQTLDWQLDISTSYEFNTEANDFEFGDDYRFDAAFKCRIFPRKLRGGVPGFFYANLESNFISQNNNMINGQTDQDSGGTTWFVAPGLQYITQRFILEGAVQLPVVQNLNGNSLENNFISTLSVRINI